MTVPITGHLGDRIIAQEEWEIADGKIEFFPDRSVLVPEIGLFGCEISLRVQIEKKAIILENIRSCKGLVDLGTYLAFLRVTLGIFFR